MTPDLPSDQRKRFQCPSCKRREESGFKLGGLLMLRCRGCGFRWSEVASDEEEV